MDNASSNILLDNDYSEQVTLEVDDSCNKVGPDYEYRECNASEFTKLNTDIKEEIDEHMLSYDCLQNGITEDVKNETNIEFISVKEGCDSEDGHQETGRLDDAPNEENCDAGYRGHNTTAVAICNHYIKGEQADNHGDNKYSRQEINSVNFLLDNAFSGSTYNEKIAVKYLKRPMPKLRLENKQSVKGRKIIRKFRSDIYQKNDWICGCDVRNAFFCFPCLLFGGEPSWSQQGVTDLVHLSAKISKHDNSEAHLKNTFSLGMLGKDVRNVFDSSYRTAIQQHNEEVRKNRHVLNLIINSIRSCSVFELVLRGHDEGVTSNNHGIFRELINFKIELGKSIRDHIESALVFKGLSKTIQNELLDAMLQVYHEQVADEIKGADYVAVIADEITNVSTQFQLVVVLRYIVNERPVERFWKFLLPTGPDRPDTNSSSTCILNEINSLIDNPEKLIAQSYDGAAVMSSVINSVQRKVQDQYPRANFVHCYAHETNLIVSHVTSSNSNCRIFFANLMGLCTFFSISPQAARLEALLRRKSSPRSSKIKWNFNSRTVNTVYEHLEVIIEVLEEIEREARLQTTIQQAGAHLRVLEDENFVYWLTFFHKIMPHVDLLFNQIKKMTTDASKVKDLDNFERAVIKIRTEIAEIDDQFVEKNDSALTPPPRKQRRLADGSERRRETIEVCNIILLEMKTRFQFTRHLILSNLVSVKQFSSFIRLFPEYCLKEAVKLYPCLNETRLKTELKVLYSGEELRKNSEISAVDLLSLLLDGLSNTFYEVIKLLKIIITIPMTTSETERKFSKLKMIKTFLRNSMKQDKLNALSVLACEKKCINEIADFNEKVIDLFCKSKTCKMDFIYRHV